MKKRLLIIEDDALVADSLCQMLSKDPDCQIESLSDGESAVKRLKDSEFDIVLVDLRLPGISGMEFIKQSKPLYPSIDFVMMTSFATVETAVAAMKLGATDYLTKPIYDDELQLLLDKIFSHRSLLKENEDLKKELSGDVDHFHDIVGSDKKMQKIYSVIRAISNTDTTILLKGESGTGKGMIAQAIHDSDPARKNGPHIEVSCGAIPRELLESEFFGHVKGAFTGAIRDDRVGRFEMANGGTILLDEIDSLPTYLQVKLLRVLQQKTFEMVGDTKTKCTDVRIIAATNQSLEELIKKGNFREDLFYRLNVISIEIPPLRERRGDIPVLIRHFLKRFNEKSKRNIKGVTKEAMCALCEYPWPGNVREVENTLERIVVLSEGDLITYECLPGNITQRSKGLHATLLPGGNLKSSLKEPEKKVILQALEQSGGNRKKAASILNINRTTLYNKMKEFDLH